MARTSQNLYSAKQLWQKVDGKSDGAFLIELLSICPDDYQTRAEVLAWHLGRLRYYIHEWPAGILYGIDGASTAECAEILEELKSARELDSDKQHRELFDEVETKVHAYLARGLPQ